MAGSLGSAVLTLTTDNSKLDKGLADGKRSAGSWADGIAGFGKTAALGVAAVGVAAAATAIGFIKAAADEEQGMIRLQQAVDNAGGSWATSKDSIETWVSAAERASGFSDGELRDSLSILTAQTGDVAEAMLRSSAAQDLARGTGMSLESASRLLGKATDENANVLQRYGVHLDKGASSTELLRVVQEKFGGQSAAYSKSVLGQWGQVQHQFGNLAEDFGAVLLPAASFVLGKIIELIDAIRTGPLPGLIAGFQDTAVKIMAAFKVSPIAAFVQTVFNQLSRIPGFVAQVAGSIGEMFDVLTGRRPDAGGVLNSLVGQDKGAEIMGVLGTVREAFSTAFDVLKPIIQGVIDKVGELRAKFEELPPVIQTVFAGVLVGQVTGANNALVGVGASLATMASGLVNVGQVMPAMLGGIGSFIKIIPTWIGLQWLAIAPLLPLVALFAAIGVAIYLLITHWEDLGSTVGMIGAIIGYFAGQAGATIGSFFSSVGSAVQGFLDFWLGVWTEITSKPGYYLGLLVGTVIGQLLNLAQGIADFAGSALATVLDWMGQLGSAWNTFWSQDILGMLMDAVGNLLGAIGEFAGSIWPTLSGALTDLQLNWNAFWNAIPAQMLEIGTAIVTGVWEGISNAAGWFLAQVQGFFAGIIDGVKRALGIASPSAVMAEIGGRMMTGLEMGIVDNAGRVYKSLDTVVSTVVRSVGTITSQLSTLTGDVGAMPAGAHVIAPAGTPISLSNWAMAHPEYQQKIWEAASTANDVAPVTTNLYLDGKLLTKAVSDRQGADYRVLAGGTA